MLKRLMPLNQHPIERTIRTVLGLALLSLTMQAIPVSRRGRLSPG